MRYVSNYEKEGPWVCLYFDFCCIFSKKFWAGYMCHEVPSFERLVWFSTKIEWLIFFINLNTFTFKIIFYSVGTQAQVVPSFLEIFHLAPSPYDPHSLPIENLEKSGLHFEVPKINKNDGKTKVQNATMLTEMDIFIFIIFHIFRIYHLRNFNNWIKSMLINEYSNKVKAKKGNLLKLGKLVQNSWGGFGSRKTYVRRWWIKYFGEIFLQNCQNHKIQ